MMPVLVEEDGDLMSIGLQVLSLAVSEESPAGDDAGQQVVPSMLKQVRNTHHASFYTHS
jgi:hypothetical protein